MYGGIRDQKEDYMDAPCAVCYIWACVCESVELV